MYVPLPFLFDALIFVLTVYKTYYTNRSARKCVRHDHELTSGNTSAVHGELLICRHQRHVNRHREHRFDILCVRCSFAIVTLLSWDE